MGNKEGILRLILITVSGSGLLFILLGLLTKIK